MQMFDETELLEMASNDDDLADRVSVLRRSAIWERLGELQSEDGLEMLLGRRPDWAFVRPESLASSDQAAHAFIGAWAAALGSLAEVQDELFPHLKRLMHAGYRKHELALGREMARFDPMEAWKILAAPADGDSSVTGGEEALIGLVRGLARDPRLSQLMPLIQERSRTELLSLKAGGSKSGGYAYWVTPDNQRSPPAVNVEVPDLSQLIASGDIKIVTPAPQAVQALGLGEAFEIPNLLSEAVGALMVSNPEEARGYLEDRGEVFLNLNRANPDQVWETVAGLDPEISMSYLEDPAFADFKSGIARGLVANAPERVQEVAGLFDDQEIQRNLLAEAVHGLNHEVREQSLPGESTGGSWMDPQEVRKIVEDAILASNLNNEEKKDFQMVLGQQGTALSESAGIPSR